MFLQSVKSLVPLVPPAQIAVARIGLSPLNRVNIALAISRLRQRRSFLLLRPSPRRRSAYALMAWWLRKRTTACGAEPHLPADCIRG
jgi:hypothetical protein